MNRFMASKVVCCDPVAVSPDACVSPTGDSEPNTMGMLPVLLKKLTSAVPTLAWLPLRPPPKLGDEGGMKLRARYQATGADSR